MDNQQLYYEIIAQVLRRIDCIKTTFTLIIADKRLYNKFIALIAGYSAIVIKYYSMSGDNFNDIYLVYNANIVLPRNMLTLGIRFWMDNYEYNGITLNVTAEAHNEVDDRLPLTDEIVEIIIDKCFHCKYEQPANGRIILRITT